MPEQNDVTFGTSRAAARAFLLVAAAALAGSMVPVAGVALAQPQPPPQPPRPYYMDAAPAKSQSPAWFNFVLPGPESDPGRGVVETVGVDLPASPVAFGRGPRDPALRGSAIHADLQTIVGFSLESRAAGEFLWGRVTGRPAFDRTMRWVLGELKSAGLEDAHLEEFTSGPINLPTAGEIRLIGHDRFGQGSRDVVLQSAMVGGAGPVNGTVTAPLIYLGQGTEADLAGRDLKGKIAVIFATPTPGLYSSLPVRRLEAMIAAGAAGAIEILAQPGNMKSFDRDRHGCGTNLCFTVGGEDGFFLHNVLGAAGKAGQTVTARLTAASETLNGATIANVVATVPGRSDRTVIINAHADGWFTAADDNGGGLATLVALARHFGKGRKPERTLVFIASAGHHSPGANGLAAFRVLHDKDYVANADLILNLEHVAVSGTVPSMVEQQNNNFGRKLVATTAEFPKQVGVNNRAPFLIDLWRQGALCFGLNTQRVVDTRNPGELGRFAELPVAQTQMISAGPVYHTSGETVSSVPPEGLERSARFHAFLIAEAARAPAALLNGAAWRPRTACPRTP
ncbi:MAG TPA: M28 family peptidase [Allosphingosinicella sp.]